jgi:hypothetical protein
MLHWRNSSGRCRKQPGKLTTLNHTCRVAEAAETHEHHSPSRGFRDWRREYAANIDGECVCVSARAPAPDVFAGSHSKGSEGGEEVSRSFRQRRAGWLTPQPRRVNETKCGHLRKPTALLGGIMGDDAGRLRGARLRRLPVDAATRRPSGLGVKTLRSVVVFLCENRPRT